MPLETILGSCLTAVIVIAIVGSFLYRAEVVSRGCLTTVIIACVAVPLLLVSASIVSIDGDRKTRRDGGDRQERRDPQYLRQAIEEQNIEKIGSAIHWNKDKIYEDGKSPIHLAVETNDGKIVAAVLESEPNIEHPRHDGKTALHIACRGSDVAIARLLLDAGADPGSTDKHGKRPIDYAVARDSLEIVNVFLEHMGGQDAEVQKLRDMAEQIQQRIEKRAERGRKTRDDAALATARSYALNGAYSLAIRAASKVIDKESDANAPVASEARRLIEQWEQLAKQKVSGR